MVDRFAKNSGTVCRLAWADNDIGTKRTEFCGDTALCVHLEIEKRGSDGRTGAKGKQNHQEPAAIGKHRPANHPPEHVPVYTTPISHSSRLEFGVESLRTRIFAVQAISLSTSLAPQNRRRLKMRGAPQWNQTAENRDDSGKAQNHGKQNHTQR